MIVYGKRTRTEDAAAKLVRIEAGHGEAALIELGELACALADRAWARAGEDDVDPAADWAQGRLRAMLAGDGRNCSHPPALLGDVEVRRAEGFCFYSVTTSGYARAAAGLGGAWRVIGVRSIGATLGAVVAHALNCPPPVTVRPFGHPWARRIAVSDALTARLRDDPNARIAVVDEGPGLSGSSFGAVLNYLHANGVPEARIVLFPSHEHPPGAEASAGALARWQRLERRPARFDADALADAVARLTGPLDAPLAEVTPPRLFARAAFQARAGGRAWRVKFAGLGLEGEEKLKLARALGNHVPRPLGLAAGYLVEPWLDATPARPAFAQLVDYLATRAAIPAEAGAGWEELLAMARHNAEDVPGFGAWLGARAGVRPPARPPVAIDGRLHGDEWLRGAGGAIVKGDALDHHRGHDLVGGQDILWDVAGASVEQGLTADQAEALLARLGGGRGQLAVMTACYLAFQLGLWTLCGDAARAAGYARRLGRMVESS